MKINLNKSAIYSLAKPKDKDYTIRDGSGLSMLIKSNVGKRWIFIYRFEGKQHRLGFGTYPKVRLSEARQKAEIARNHISEDMNPLEVTNAEKAAKRSTEHANNVAKQLAAEIAQRLVESDLPLSNIFEFKVTIEVLKWR